MEAGSDREIERTDTPVAEVDVRVGGKLRLVMRSPGGQEFSGSGEFIEVTPPGR
jgi:uncharacterized protein YndB with AHSA1/START domain